MHRWMNGLQTDRYRLRCMVAHGQQLKWVAEGVFNGGIAYDVLDGIALLVVVC